MNIKVTGTAYTLPTNFLTSSDDKELLIYTLRSDDPIVRELSLRLQYRIELSNSSRNGLRK